MGVADQRDPLALVREPARLLGGHERLTAAGAAWISTRGSNWIAGIAACCWVRMSAASSFSRARATTSRCGSPRPPSAACNCSMAMSVKSGRSVFWVRAISRSLSARGAPCRCGRSPSSAGSRVPRSPGRNSLFGKTTAWFHRGPALRPARVGFDEVAQRVARLAHLLDGVDGLDMAAATALQPMITGMPYLTSLDLEADDAGTADGHDESRSRGPSGDR